MVTLRRIGVKSAGLVGFWTGIALTLTQVIIFLTVFFISGGFPTFALQLEFWFAVLRFAILAALQTAVLFGALAYIYNIIAQWHGGLTLEFDVVPMVAKRKNDHMAEAADDDTDDDNGVSGAKKPIDID